ncbi:RNA polymerase sigma factor [Paenibacillus pasadenensis]|uniref:RNA polymerase sigma factor n=1 Tax=Paenibacillus pasadenensis TaxID=217090 RepID=UPI0003F964AE|nr:RNA polymerase sigma factor [Paenibacillus pasadenensis]
MESEPNLASWEQLVKLHRQPLFSYCYHMLRHKQEAEDAVQEAFFQAMRRPRGIADISNARAWLYKIAHRHCLNVMKRKNRLSFLLALVKRETEAASDAPPPGAHPVEELLALLSPLDRSIVVLRIVEERSYEDIAEIAQTTAGAVRKRFERARRTIRQACGPEGGSSHDAQSKARPVSFL